MKEACVITLILFSSIINTGLFFNDPFKINAPQIGDPVLSKTVSLSFPSNYPDTGQQPTLKLEILELSKTLIDEHTPGMEAVKYGNEGGEVIKDDKGIYHWFTSEQFGDPYWVANRITHWTSSDGAHWTKDNSWSKEGNHDYTSTKDKSSYFDPTVKYDGKTGFWYIFYVAYRNAPDTSYNGGNNRGKIFRSKAVRPGIDGLGGPYHDNDKDDVVILEPLDNPPPYEAKWVGNKKFGYGCHTVTPYKIGGLWYILWAENLIAKGTSSLSGKFKRLPEGENNPVTWNRKPLQFVPDYRTATHQFYLENPIIYKIPSGRAGAGKYIMVVGEYIDHVIGLRETSYGYASSEDGMRWSELKPLASRFGDCITACSFIPEGNDKYSIYVTGRDGYERFARITVKIREDKD
ncbi:MAG: hypothetical protein H0X41_04680 [Chitinophagaceae bacterium]|nr:hypothetical protein [Chitinophagaceae bacterium]